MPFAQVVTTIQGHGRAMVQHRAVTFDIQARQPILQQHRSPVEQRRASQPQHGLPAPLCRVHGAFKAQHGTLFDQDANFVGALLHLTLKAWLRWMAQ
ncbi:hypothetical protein, partial [Aquabacterium sp. UBA2148]|uniref:hypothetical protein n=1 Tax=Aquabacterium sp. UBA2148 TaxID=1946042 RepID=UPI00257DD668